MGELEVGLVATGSSLPFQCVYAGGKVTGELLLDTCAGVRSGDSLGVNVQWHHVRRIREPLELALCLDRYWGRCVV